jgi:hypothetical protein
MTEPAPSNVTALPGVAIRTRESDREVVEAAERLLADAQAGILAGFAFAALTVDGLVKYHWIGASVPGNSMGGAIALLNAGFNAARLTQYQDERD